MAEVGIPGMEAGRQIMARSQSISLKMQLLTPLHIGGASGNLSPIEFVAFGDRVYVISEEKWAQVLKVKGWIKKFLEEGVGKQRFGLGAFLRKKESLTEAFFKKHTIARYSSTSAYAPERDLRPFVRDGLDQPFIPGSAIKGALRTGLLYAYLKEVKQRNQGQLPQQIVGPIRAILKDRKVEPRKKMTELGAALVQNVFQDNMLGGVPVGPHTDLLRCLKIDDAYLPHYDKDSLTIEQVRVLSLDSDPHNPNGWRYSSGREGKNQQHLGERRQSPFALYPECIVGKPDHALPECTIHVRVDLDCFMRFQPSSSPQIPGESLKDFIMRKMEDQKGNSYAEVLLKTILVLAQGATRDWITYEQAFFNQLKGVDKITKFYAHPGFQPTLRLGWGSGIGQATVLSLLPNGIQKDVARLYWRRLPRQALERFSNDFVTFPKTRRVIVRNNVPETVLGWVKLGF